MSRSTKKPYYTDHSAKETVKKKRRANKRVRNAEAPIASGKSYKKVSNSWDISDYSFYSPKDKKASRK